MHKFQPRLHLVVLEGGAGVPGPGSLTDISGYRHKSWVFTQTVFTAVTAYQNQLVSAAPCCWLLVLTLCCLQITKLKIDSNPFAKGFRDSAAADYDEPFTPSLPGLAGMPPMPGGMPGPDPFSRMRYQPEPNNNLMMAAEKARMMMLMSPPVSAPTPAPLPLSPELLARYSALQASLQGLYSPALLAAALRTSSAPATPQLSSLNSSLSSPRSPELSPSSLASHRYSPYMVPKQRHSPSPSSSPSAPHTMRTPSPGISPPPQFPSHAFPILR